MERENFGVVGVIGGEIAPRTTRITRMEWENFGVIGGGISPRGTA